LQIKTKYSKLAQK